MLEHLAWFFFVSDPLRILLPLWRPVLIALLLYHGDYFFLAMRHFLWKAFGRGDAWHLGPDEAPAMLLVLPTLLGTEGDLAGIVRAVDSVLASAYPGPRIVVCSIDDRGARSELYAKLCRVLRSTPMPTHTRLLVTGTDERRGKAMAIDHAVQLVRTMVRMGELPSMPPVFFNMDADGEVLPETLERMVSKLVRPGLFGARPMIVAPNVSVREKNYWSGWRGFFSLRGQLSLQVAREFMTSISLSKQNTRFFPVTSVSGALYCTWTYFHLEGPRFAAFLTTLTTRDRRRWWLGLGAPSFRAWRGPALPEAMIGPGDDTYVAWMVSMARWDRDAPVLDFPSTPLASFLGGLRYWFVRPIAFDPLAKVFTGSPTTFRGLWNQRLRWNGSRLFNWRRLGPALRFHFGPALAIWSDLAILAVTNGAFFVTLVMIPFADHPHNWMCLSTVVVGFFLMVRALGIALAMLLDGDFRQWRKLLGIPLSVPFHVVFNILTTFVAWIQDLLLFGARTTFAPEETLIRSRTDRPALAYRVRRAVLLAWRSMLRGDVPFGRFWFGWHETPWTPNGYDGWTSKQPQASVRAPTPVRDDDAARELAAAE